MAKRTCARLFAECLVDHDVEYVFGMPAGFGDELLWAEITSIGIKPILIHDERSAIWMAEGYARSSGKPGFVCIGSQAVGHAINGLIDPYNFHVPVIVSTWTWDPLTECDKYESHGPTEYIPGILQHVTKQVFRFHSAARVPDYINAAFRVATTGIPGPVVLINPDVMFFEELDAPRNQDRTYNRYPANRVSPDPQLVEKAATIIAEAERPVVLTANFGSHASDFVSSFRACAELRELAELIVAPVAGSKGVLPDTHPLYVGTPGAIGTGLHSPGRLANELLRKADLVLMVGARPGASVTLGFTAPPLGTRIVHIDFDPKAIGAAYPVELALVGDLQYSLRALTAALRSRGYKAPAARIERTRAELGSFKREWEAMVESALSSSDVPIHCPRVIHEINRYVDENTIVGRGGGFSAGVYGTHYLKVKASDLGWMGLSSGAAQIGCALSTALGVKLGAPDRRLILIDGDGSFGYSIMELETAARYGIDVVFIILNNSSLFYDRACVFNILKDFKPEVLKKIYDFRQVDFGAVATAMGCLGITVNKPDEIAPALEKAFAFKGPCIIDVRVKTPSREEVQLTMNTD